MNSVIMSYIFRDPESQSAKDLVKDLQTFVSIDDGQRKTILDSLSLFRLSRTNNEDKKFLEELSSKIGLKLVTVDASIGLTKFLLDKILDSDIPNDDYEHWADDLEEAKALCTPDEKKTFGEIIENIKVIAVNEVEPETKRRKAAQNVGKGFRRISVSVGIFPVNDKPYIGLLSSNDYEPKIIDTVASATVSLSIGDEPTENIVFNLEEYGIDKLIEHLKAAKKDIATLKKFIKV